MQGNTVVPRETDEHMPNLAGSPGDRAGWDAEDEEAANEHRSLDDLPLCIAPEELVKRLGMGVVWYFTFVKFLCFFNAVLVGISLINIIPHLESVSDRDDKPGFPGVLYLSTYDGGTKDPWLVSSSLSVVLIFFLGPTYRAYVRHYQSKRERGEAGFIEDPFEGQYAVDTDECVDKIEYDVAPHRSEQIFRRTISITIFVAVLFLQGIINYYLQNALRGEGGSRSATAIAFFIVVVNLGWKYLCKGLTKFELHLFYSDFKRWDVLKVLIFKLCNVLTLYFVKAYELSRNTEECPLFLMADQFLLLLIVDITVMNVVEIILPMLWNVMTARWAEKSHEANDAIRPEFDLAEEYVELAYRQFIVGLGVFVVPILPLIALLGNVLEYWLDKLRLLRIAAKPKRTRNTYRDILMFSFFLSGVFILIAYPNGGVWVMSGRSANLSDRCAIYN